MSGTLLAFDFGTKSIGVAVGQRITGTARPLPAIKAQDGTPDWNLIERLLKEWQPDEIIVGLPLNMDVAEQPQNGVVRRFFGMCLDVPYVVRREREERRLGARNEGRDRQQAHRDRSRQEQTDVYGVECDQTAFQIRLFSFCTACRRISRRASRPSPAEVSPRRRPPP